MSFRLAVCAEMVYGELPLAERVHRIHGHGFDVELWDTRGRDIGALAATGARFSSMSGYFGGSLIDPDGAREVLASAEKLIPMALELGVERMVVHPAELGEGGRAVRPLHRSTGEMWLAGLRTLERLGELGAKLHHLFPGALVSGFGGLSPDLRFLEVYAGKDAFLL